MSNMKYIDEETYNLISKYIISTNDIFITIAGSTGIVGTIPPELNNSNLTENAVKLILNNQLIKNYVMYYLIYNSSNDFKLKTNKTTIPKLSISNISKIKIKLPQNKQLITDLDPTFEEIETLQTDVKDAEELYQQYIQELSSEAIITF